MDLGVAHLNALELAPEAYIPAAAKVGFRGVGLRIHPVADGGVHYPLPAGSDALRRVKSLLRNEGVHVNEVEFINISPDIDVRKYAHMLETGGELGATCLTVAGEDSDRARMAANFAALCDMAAPYGIRVDVEFMAWRVVATIHDGAALVAAAGKPNGAVLLDSVHLARSGGSPADIAGVPCKAAQICDGPLANPVGTEALIYEARSHRLLPGDGELPLIDFLRALPPGTAISAEVPMPNTDAQTKLNLAAEATRKIVALAA